jgi:PAS domain-containing protein
MQSPLFFALVLVGTSMLTMIAVLMIAGAFRRTARPHGAAPSGGGDPVFLFEDEVLIDANERGAALHASLRQTGTQGEGSDWQRLMRFLAADFPDLKQHLADHQDDGTFSLTANDPARNLDLTVERSSGTLRLTLIDTLAEDGVVTLDRLSHRAMQDELTLLRRLIDAAPFMFWREGAQGQVTWANGAYLRRLATQSELMTWPLPALFSGGKPDSPQRISLADPTHPARLSWFDVNRVADDDGLLAFALPADDVHQAERAKRDFIQTLTKTFATLPIGLAVFDRTRRLQMFNPALTDLTGLETEFLLSRPGLEGFLNRMRDKHILPEPRDYRSWARRLLDIETNAPQGEFEETWTLPSGQTFRVSANPHPDGALAFLIEDITSETHLTRNVRAEMETSQSVLNQIDAAIAVFATNGQLVLTNAAFSRLWTLEGEETLSAVTLPEALENWRDVGDNPQLWVDVAALLQPGGKHLAPVTGIMTLADGEQLSVDARRTSTGALMIAFTQPGETKTAPELNSRAGHRAQILRASA